MRNAPARRDGAMMTKAMSTLRQQIISRIEVRESQQLADLAMRWWVAIAAELIPLVGYEGFFAMYNRSVSLTRARFPWIGPQKSDLKFVALKISLEKNEPNDALEASVELLVQFTNILDTLIGDDLTSGIISAAWRQETSKDGEES